MIGIWKHISVNIKVYWLIYVNWPKFRSIYAWNRFLKIFIYRSKNEKFLHISVEIWFFEKFHISVNIKLTYIGQYMNFNIDRYMVSYSGRSLSQARCFIWQSRNGLPLKNILNSFLWKSPQDLSIVLWPTDIWLTASVDLFSKIFRSRDFTFAFIFHFIPCNFAETFANLFLWNVLVNFFSPSRFFTFDSSSFTWLTFLSRARCAHSRFRCRRLFRLSNCFGVN